VEALRDDRGASLSLPELTRNEARERIGLPAIGDIPRTFHRVWLDEPIPEQYETYWYTLQDMHPDWDFLTWSDSKVLLSWMQNAELFSSFTQKPESYGLRSDIARYEILARYGGIYLDTDVEPVRPFDSLLGDAPFVAWCSEVELDPSVLASPAGHPAIQFLVEELAKITPAVGTRYLSPPGTTGPTFITTHWRARKDVRRLPPGVFFPYHWSDKEPNHARPPWPAHTIAVHRWSAGWKPTESASRRARIQTGDTVREPMFA